MLLPTKKRAYFCTTIVIDMGRCIAILFNSMGVRGRCDSPDSIVVKTQDPLDGSFYCGLFARSLGDMLKGR